MQSVTAGYLTSIIGNGRQFIPRLSFYFDGESEDPTIFDNTNYFKDFSGIEELYKDGEILFNLSSNQITINLINDQKIFTPTNTTSPYYGKILPGIKVKVELGLWVTSAYEYTTIGIFYTTEWSDDNNTTTSVTCNDRLYSILDREINILDTFRIRLDITIIDAWKLVFDTLNWVENTDYILDANLTDTLKYFFLRGTYREVFMNLLQAGLSKGIIGKDGIFRVDIIDITGDTSRATFTDSNSIIHSNNPQGLSETYNKILIRYFNKGAIPNTLRDMVNYDIQEGSGLGLKVDEEVSQMSSIFIKSNTFADTPTLTSYDWSNQLLILNLSTEAVDTLIDVVVEGEYLDNTPQELIKTSAIFLPSEDNILEIENIILNKVQAGALGDILLDIYEQSNSIIISETKGCPPLDPGDLYTINNVVEKVPTQILFLIRNEYKFTGTLNSTFTGIKKELIPGGV